MGDQQRPQGQAWIRERVIGQGLCTGCGACVGLCPYHSHFQDRTAVIHECDRPQGRCSAYCPRSPADLAALKAALYDPADLTPELGAVKGLYATRAADPSVRSRAQHGGTVSALVALALAEGLLDAAVAAGGGEDLLPEPAEARAASQALAQAGSKFVVSPAVERFNRVSLGEARRIGVVATPCQALALAKMRAWPQPGDEARTAKLALVIGLFCGWALDWRGLSGLLAAKLPGRAIGGMDIPPSSHACLEVYTDRGTEKIDLAEVEAHVRPACRYCHDMTCEFADLSVGGARSPEGWEVDKGWNQVLVRSARGQELLDLAQERGALEFKEVPPGNLEKLKAASLKKKRTSAQRLAALSGSPDDLVYISKEDALCQ
jgi:coenzyme F420 hydrogenase subunit beta